MKQYENLEARLCLRLTPSMMQALERMAKAEGLSKRHLGKLIRTIINQYIYDNNIKNTKPHRKNTAR